MDVNNQSLDGGHVSALLRLDWNRFAVLIYGFLMPLITLVTLINNALVLAVLLRRQMRSPTNALLAALAVSDTLMSACPMPHFVYFYTVGQRYLDWVPYSWCFAYFCLTDYVPTVFHTASIWLTTSLAAQRYAHVCCRVDSKLRQFLCSMRGAVRVICGVYITAIASQACRFGELTFSAVVVPSLLNTTPHDDGNTTTVVEVTACQYEQTAFIARHETVYYNIYYWSRVVLIHLIPCTALVVLNARLIRTMRAAHNRRRRMSPWSTLGGGRRAEARASKNEVQALTSSSNALALVPLNPPRQRRSSTVSGSDSSTRSTRMLLVVVGVFLLVEVPLSVLLLLVIVENTFGLDLFSDTARYTAALFVNCSIAVACPLNFFVYCAMSERFRRMFGALFSRRTNFNNAPPSAQGAVHRTARTELHSH